jgi:hypothetical protein
MEENEEFEIIEPFDYSLGPILDIHEKDYVRFLETIFDEWVADGLPAKGCIGDIFMHPSLIAKLDPATIKKNAYKNARGKMALHNFDLSVAFVKGKFPPPPFCMILWLTHFISRYMEINLLVCSGCTLGWPSLIRKQCRRRLCLV